MCVYVREVSVLRVVLERVQRCEEGSRSVGHVVDDVFGVAVLIEGASFEICEFTFGIDLCVDVFAVVDRANVDGAAAVLVFSDDTVTDVDGIEVADVRVDDFSKRAGGMGRDACVVFVADDHHFGSLTLSVRECFFSMVLL